MEGLDTVLGHLQHVAGAVETRYELVVVSDHGQSLGQTFEQLTGQSLAERIADLMQYVHRRLHRSVTETRRSRATRPNWSGSPTSPGAPCGRRCGVGRAVTDQLYAASHPAHAG